MSIPSPDRLRELRALHEQRANDRRKSDGSDSILGQQDRDIVALIDSHLAGAGAQSQADLIPTEQIVEGLGSIAIAVNSNKWNGELAWLRRAQRRLTGEDGYVKPTPPPAADKPTWTREDTAWANYRLHDLGIGGVPRPECPEGCEGPHELPQPASQARELLGPVGWGVFQYNGRLLEVVHTEGDKAYAESCGGRYVVPLYIEPTECKSLNEAHSVAAISALSATPARGELVDELRRGLQDIADINNDRYHDCSDYERGYGAGIYFAKMIARRVLSDAAAPPTQDAAGGS